MESNEYNNITNLKSTHTGHHSIDIKLQTDHMETSQCPMETYHSPALTDQALKVRWPLPLTVRDLVWALRFHIARIQTTETALGP